MKKKTASEIISVLLSLAVLVSGCASSTMLSTTPSGADVYIQGQRRGTTPYTYSDRKIVGASTMVTFKKEGYEDYNTTIRKTKKLNVGALLSGMLFIYPWFWLLGYDRAHSYDLDEAVDLAEPVAVAEPEKPEIEAPEAPALELADSITLPTSSRIEKLLSQNQIDKAVEYANDQEGSFQAGCYYSLAQYFLEKKDYSNAEDFYTRSGKTKEGNVRIAESLMRGEVKDSILVIDERKVKSYLAKAYDSEEEVTYKMASCYEKYANESKDRIELAKKLKDGGMISMSSGGKTVNIDRALALSRVTAIFYLNSAINAYEDLNNIEKTQELRNENEAISEDLREAASSGQTAADKSTEKVQPVINDTKDIKVVLRGKGLTAEDEHVFITIDSIVRTPTQPEDLVKALEASNNYLKSRPARNADYVLVYFTRTVKKELNLSSKELSRANISLLSDQSLKNYTMILERGSNYINVPEGGRIWFNPDLPILQAMDESGKYDGVIINYNYMMFYMPVTSTPDQLKYQYNYKNDENDRKPTTGTLTINLTQ